jgi:CheY-like chemotaxis protein
MPIRKSILIVDDDELLPGIIRGVLEDGGHAVSCCHNGADAIELLKERNFDVILTDYQMPGMKGDVVCRLLRRHRPDAFIIGFSIEHKDEAFLNAGADAFIRKDRLIQELGLLMKSETASGRERDV